MSDSDREGRTQVTESDNGRPDGKKRNSKENFSALFIRVSRKKLFFELSLVLLTTHAIGLEEPTKNFQRYRPINDIWGTISILGVFTL